MLTECPAVQNYTVVAYTCCTMQAGQSSKYIIRLLESMILVLASYIEMVLVNVYQSFQFRSCWTGFSHALSVKVVKCVGVQPVSHSNRKYCHGEGWRQPPEFQCLRAGSVKHGTTWDSQALENETAVGHSITIQAQFQ